MGKKRPESVLVVIQAADSEVLLMERADWPGFWQSVTGSLEWDESPKDAAERELHEETGLHISQGNLVDCGETNTYEIFEQFRHKYAEDQRTNVEHVFTFKLPQKREILLSAREHRQYQWLSKQKACEQAFTQTDKAAIYKWVKEPVKL